MTVGVPLPNGATGISLPLCAIDTVLLTMKSVAKHAAIAALLLSVIALNLFVFAMRKGGSRMAGQTNRRETRRPVCDENGDDCAALQVRYSQWQGETAMKTAAAFALLLAMPTAAQTLPPEPPKPGTLRLYPVYSSKTETVFVDTTSLVRTGDTVEGWGLNIYLNPTLVAGHMTDVHWTRFRMSCAGLVVTATWILGRKLITTTFAARLDKTIAIQRRTGWDQTHAYMCKSVPIFTSKPWTSETVAIVEAQVQLKRKQQQ
ncbi:MAG: hypothetical protein EOP58_06900 [Sphingomonadales bacterium]|nr:MAG: hypothetical protein EOP58_06900 [Sphingomonadales bacterium]